MAELENQGERELGTLLRRQVAFSIVKSFDQLRGLSGFVASLRSWRRGKSPEHPQREKEKICRARENRSLNQVRKEES